MNRVRTSGVAVAALTFAAVAVVGCSGGSDDDGDPGLDRIDGPAQVDPDVEIGGSPTDSSEDSPTDSLQDSDE